MSSASYPALVLTLRFPSGLPDLKLPLIMNPATTTGLSLLPRIRTNLPKSRSSLRILLIHSGRVISLKERLATSLRLPTIKSLGKARASEPSDDLSRVSDEQDATTIYWIIHATFSALDHPLTAEELESEQREGQALNSALCATASQTSSNHESTATSSRQNDSQVPQGFDRLLVAGIPADEVSSLRAQFRALLAAEQPSNALLVPAEIRDLEERWLDSAAMPADGGNLLASLNGIGADTTGSSSNYIDDVLWGNILGFFWPLGALFWLSRQDGIWRDQRTASVFVGFLVNVVFCVVRIGLLGAGAAS